jgi:hypothetical protein
MLSAPEKRNGFGKKVRCPPTARLPPVFLGDFGTSRICGSGKNIYRVAVLAEEQGTVR